MWFCTVLAWIVTRGCIVHKEPPPYAAHLLLLTQNRGWKIQNMMLVFGQRHKTYCWWRKPTEQTHTRKDGQLDTGQASGSWREKWREFKVRWFVIKHYYKVVDCVDLQCWNKQLSQLERVMYSFSLYQIKLQIRQKLMKIYPILLKRKKTTVAVI